jgi:hypothetical protein
MNQTSAFHLGLNMDGSYLDNNDPELQIYQESKGARRHRNAPPEETPLRIFCKLL